jgi:acyl-CoA thioesterase-1
MGAAEDWSDMEAAYVAWHGLCHALKPYGQAARLFNVVWLALALWSGAAVAGEHPLRLVAFGDSLTAGYRLQASAAFPAQLERALAAQGRQVVVINAGVSGDTTAGGLARLDWMLDERPDAVILELGANDALRGVKPAVTYENLDRILTRLGARGVPVLLAGMRAPPNLGRRYGNRFNAVYPRLVEKHGVPLYPFFLAGVATNRALKLRDGMHPNRAGVAVMVARILPYVLRLLDGLR